MKYCLLFTLIISFTVLEVEASNKRVLRDGAKAWQCGKHTESGLPMLSDNFLCRKTYALGYNYENKAPDWVMFYLNGFYVRKDAGIPQPAIQNDSSITSKKRIKLRRYDDTPYSPGSLVPFSSIDIDSKSVYQASLQTATAPMLQTFESNVWNKLLDSYRNWAANYNGDIIGITGPIYKSDDNGTLPYSKNLVANLPTHYFAVGLNVSTMESIAFLLPASENIFFEKINDYRVTIDEIELLSGLDMFNNLKVSQQKEFESMVNRQWTLSEATKIY